MSNRNSFLVSVGTTLTIGWFGVIGAFYIEFFQLAGEPRNFLALIVDSVIIIVFGSVIGSMYLEVLKSIEEENEL